MNRIHRLAIFCVSVGLAISHLLLNSSALLAQQMVEEGKSASELAGVSPALWAIPYIIVVIVLGSGIFCVVMSSKRIDRPKKD
ncbi:MAG: hypothetical protein PHE53_03225 [Thermoguttaceae bacterium]|nr:hypothetical protein [Thermoguttaceae bacterium]